MKLSLDTIVMLGSIVSAGIYVGVLEANTRSNAEDIQSIKQDQKIYNKTIMQVDRRLSRIEGALNIEEQEELKKIIKRK